jgi:hypothetical protein
MSSLPVGAWVGFILNFWRTHVAPRGYESERTDLHSTLGQLRLEPVLCFLADFFELFGTFLCRLCIVINMLSTRKHSNAIYVVLNYI